MQTEVERIKPGAAIECRDGLLGSVESIEYDAAGRPEFVRVARGWTGRQVLVPLHLVEAVADDGSVRLACARADAEQLLEAASPAEHLADSAAPVEPIDGADFERTVELREEELVARKEMREAGAAEIRKVVEEVPSRLEVDALREEVIVEHVPSGEVVREKVAPWTEDDGTLVVPVYEEQLVLVKRLVMREQIRVRREVTTERRLFEDTVRRERLVVEDPDDTGLVREQYATEADVDRADDERGDRPKGEGGLLDKVIWKALQ